MKENIKSLLIAVVLAVLFRSFLFEPYKVPTGSMNPTVLEGDYLFVSKYYYGLSKHSFPFSPNLFEGRILEFNEPKRGEIIVFKKPPYQDINYIKRLIGLPGDQIQMRDGILYINGNALPKEYQGTFTNIEGEIIKKYKETMPEGVSYSILDHYPDHEADNTSIYTVPKGYYFFMGDNRDHSLDSRYVNHVGFVPRDNIIGKAEIVIFSDTAQWFEVWKWFSNLRYNRFFKLLH